MTSTSTSAFSSAELASNVATIHRVSSKRIVSASAHGWNGDVLERIDELVKLPTNWNGYGAEGVSFQTANFAMSMLASACPQSAPKPQIVPGVDGDLQVEWHSLEYDIELHVRAPFDVGATRISGDEVEEVELRNEFSIVARWLNDMETAVAARAAAA